MREHLYSVYIMASRSGVLYIGVTSDLQTRVRQHKAGTFGGCSKKYRCHRLVYYERYDYIQAAIGREKQLKGVTAKRRLH
jgi:putative endonuclease